MTEKPIENWKAEIMSIGDEIVTGVRLDTNTQWISAMLGDLGIAVHFHSTVGDDLDDHVSALKIATSRADLVIMTGGIGPTADDLTRQAVGRAAGVALRFDDDEMGKIEKIFRRAGREMPDNNRFQAWFPLGSIVINNPEGTAPGFQLDVVRSNDSPCRIIALPGVPAEMKQMWKETVGPSLSKIGNSVFHYETLHCFGAGESTIESMLPNLVQRGRDPKVGITASNATISLRVATRAATIEECKAKILPTLETIRESLGDLVFGKNNETLTDVVHHELNKHPFRIAICDGGMNGSLAATLQTKHTETDDAPQSYLVEVPFPSPESNFSGDTKELIQLAERNLKAQEVDLSLVISPIDRTESRVVNGQSNYHVAIAFQSSDRGLDSGVNESLGCEIREHRYWGHSAWREDRALKQVLNQLRLFLASRTTGPPPRDKQQP